MCLFSESTLWFFEDKQEDEYFVRTAQYALAKKTLGEKNMVILTGHPGEGKTTMAVALALEGVTGVTDPANCIKLDNPSDWRRVDWSLKLFTTLIIDDIFGGGSLNQNLVNEWTKYLPDIKNAAKLKRLRVIITTRHYIKEEALEDLDKITMFDDQDGFIVKLTSAELTNEEKINILGSRIRKSGMDVVAKYHVSFEDCVENSAGMMNVTSGRREDFVFGFPQCATLFASSEKLIKTGPTFFSRPEEHFKTYIEQLYKAKDPDQFHKFLALVAVWAEAKMRVKETDMQNEEQVSPHVRSIAKCFGIPITHRFLEILKSSLKSHVQDLLLMIEHSGEYTFSHNVNGDMVGIVLGNDKPIECIKLCPRDFLMERMAIVKTDESQLRICVLQRHFKTLCERFVDMICRKGCNLIHKDLPSVEFNALQRKGPRSNQIDVKNDLDFGVLKHPAFENENFVKEFTTYVKDKQRKDELFNVPVIIMTGYFLDYGIKMERMVMYLPGYTLYSGLSVLAKELIEQGVFPRDHTDPLLLATHSGNTDMMKLLLRHGAKVSGDTIYVAMHKMYKKKLCVNPSVLETILGYKGIDINNKGNAVNGNYPLIVAARKGFAEAVTSLLKNGADPSVQNDKRMTALHKAVIYKHKAIVETLLAFNAPLNVKGGKFKRTPLHIAADIGETELVQMLLSKGADTTAKDHRGHYPIFLAAIRSNIETVRVLLKHDKTQDSLRIASYGKKSLIKGMSLFHVAVWKNDKNLLQLLIEEKANANIQDFFGQTPLFFAIMKGKKTAMKLLLAYADKNIAQKQGYTPLHAAIHKGNLKMAAKLAKDVDVNMPDKYGCTPLHVACEKADYKAAHLLLKKHNADPSMITKRGDTVFHILRRKKGNASREEHCKRRLIELLLLEVDNTLLDRMRDTKNRKGVPVGDDTGLTMRDAQAVASLRQNIADDYGDLSDDDEPSPSSNTARAGTGQAVAVEDLLRMLASLNNRRIVDLDDDDQIAFDYFGDEIDYDDGNVYDDEVDDDF